MPTNARKPRGGGRTPSLRGILVVDTTRGNLRVRAWPKPRGKNRHPTNVYWSQWLNAATYLYRYQPAKFQAALQRATEGTPWMPRDIFISALRGRAWSFSDENGRRYYPMAYRVDVSQSLDSIAQLPGQMLFRGPSLWMPISPGTPGYKLTYVDDNTPPEWQAGSVSTFTGCRLTHNANQNVANNTNVALTFNTETFDIGGMHSTVTNPTRITAQQAGYYLIGGMGQWDTNTTADRVFFIRLNGTTELVNQSVPTPNSNFRQIALSTIYHLAIGDYVELIARQNSGGTRTVNANLASPTFWATLLGT